MLQYITVLVEGDKYGKCTPTGHDYTVGMPYFWDIRNGWFQRCKICGRQIVIKEISLEEEAVE